jgi:hypothetical protein
MGRCPGLVCGYATAKCQAVFSLLTAVPLLQPPPEPVDGNFGLSQVGVRHNHQKLVASITGNEVRRAKILLKQGRNLDKDAIP